MGFPTENANVFKVIGKSSTSFKLGRNQYLSYKKFATCQGNVSFIQYKNYELVNEDVSGGGLSKSATSSLYNLFYNTLGVLMAPFAPVTSQLAWLPSV